MLAAIAVMLMRTEPDPEARPRLILGAAMITLPTLGLWHLWSGSPDGPGRRQHAAGFLGFAIGGPLSDGLTEWIAAPLLFIGVLFGLLLVTGTTIREVPVDRAARCSPRAHSAVTTTTTSTTTTGRVTPRQSEDFSDGYYDDPSAYADDEAQAWPERHPDGQLPARRRGARPFPSRPPRRAAREARPSKQTPGAGPRRRGPLHAAVAGSADRGRSAEAAQRGQRPA